MQLSRRCCSGLVLLSLLTCMVLVPVSVGAQPMFTVGVSILPQKYFVERIAGDKTNVVVMVGPGYNPVTYEPKPRQLSQLQKASLYFLIGVPFENNWMNVFSQVNPELKIVALPNAITFRAMARSINLSGEAEISAHGHSHSSMMDPHIWLSPRLVKQLAFSIKSAFVGIDPNNKEYYQLNYQRFIDDLDDLDRAIRREVNSVGNRQFMVFHPSWGYFADEYGLQQIPIELEGKRPRAKSLTGLMEFAQRKQVKVIFVQPQFSDSDAKTIAGYIGAKVVYVDPLAENYLENLYQTTRQFVEALK
jgi:zinc transport system substrate-binding protein